MGTVGVVLIPALGLSDLLVDRRLGALQLGRSRRGGCVTVVDRSECCGGFGVCLRVVLRYAFFTPGQNTNQFYSALAASPVDSPFSNVALSIFLILARMAAVGVTYEAVRGRKWYGNRSICDNLHGTVAGAPEFQCWHALSGAASPPPGCFRGERHKRRPLADQPRRIRGADSQGRHRGVGLGLACPRSFAVAVRTLEFAVTAGSAREVFAFMRGGIPPNAVLAATKIWSFQLFTQRTTNRIPTLGRGAEGRDLSGRCVSTRVQGEARSGLWRRIFHTRWNPRRGEISGYRTEYSFVANGVRWRW